METLLIELTNQKAYKLIQDMEELNLIRVLKKPVKLSLLRGKIKTKMSDEDIDKRLNTLRQEWERNT
ncbi:MAG: hypothetical protein KGM16_10885 [Bacteroidota bacterium]|nr:hypothetical protein [Bacteroidota bacterium]